MRNVHANLLVNLLAHPKANAYARIAEPIGIHPKKVHRAFAKSARIEENPD
jgi:hypothetical protein